VHCSEISHQLTHGKAAGFGRLLTDPQFLQQYDTWQSMKDRCSQAGGSLLVADSAYKRQYALNAMLWGDPQASTQPLQPSTSAKVQLQGAVGAVQDQGATLAIEGWFWCGAAGPRHRFARPQQQRQLSSCVAGRTAHL